MNYVGFQEPVMAYKKVSEKDNDTNKIIEMLKNGVTGVVQAPKNTEKELHITSIFKVEPPIESKPEIVVQEEQPVVETPAKSTLPPLEIVIEDMSDIDPRSLGKLMIELKGKVDLTIVHGDNSIDDIVTKLCNGLEVNMLPVYGPDGKFNVAWNGKRRLTRCQPGEKPQFDILKAS
jgi:hypothetical protein